MPTAVPELIAQELISRLEAITTGNGYAFTVPSVDRVNRDANDWKPKNNSIVVVQGDDERDPESDRPGNPPAEAHRLTFEIKGIVRQADRATTADQSKENEMTATIKEAVSSVSQWHTFDGNSWNAEWGTTSRITSDTGSYAGVSLELIVSYRVSETDPYTVRA